MVERSWFRAYFPYFTWFGKKSVIFHNFLIFFRIFWLFYEFLRNFDQKFDCFPAFISGFYHFFSHFFIIYLWFSNFFYPGRSYDHGFGCIFDFLLDLEKKWQKLHNFWNFWNFFVYFLTILSFFPFFFLNFDMFLDFFIKKCSYLLIFPHFPHFSKIFI